MRRRMADSPMNVELRRHPAGSNCHSNWILEYCLGYRTVILIGSWDIPVSMIASRLLDWHAGTVPVPCFKVSYLRGMFHERFSM